MTNYDHEILMQYDICVIAIAPISTGILSSTQWSYGEKQFGEMKTAQSAKSSKRANTSQHAPFVLRLIIGTKL